MIRERASTRFSSLECFACTEMHSITTIFIFSHCVRRVLFLLSSACFDIYGIDFCARRLFIRTVSNSCRCPSPPAPPLVSYMLQCSKSNTWRTRRPNASRIYQARCSIHTLRIILINYISTTLYVRKITKRGDASCKSNFKFSIVLCELDIL